MKKMIKKLLSLTIAAFMIVSMIPGSVFAASAAETTTVVTTETELADALLIGGEIVFGNDITAADIIVASVDGTVINGAGYTLTSTAARAINVSGADGVTIKDLTINASGERAINVIKNATNITLENVTATAANYAVNLAASATGAVVTINSCNLTGLNVVNVAAANANVTVNGGTIICNDQSEESYAALALNKDATDATITATGVTFVINGDSAETKIDAEGGTIIVDGEASDEKSVAIIDYSNGYYYSFATLEDAFNKAESGETVKLISDVEIDTETITIPEDKSVTLDMNGKTITVTDNSTTNYELFYIYGELTVTGNGIITLTSTNDRDWNAMSAIFHNRGGILTIENGTYTNLGGTDMAWVVDNSGNWYGDATTNINGGTLTSSYTAIRNRMEQNSHGYSGTAILNITDGTINGTTSAIWAQAASTSTTSPATGEINISGGDIGTINTARSAGAECMTTISGGTVASFKGEVGELTVTGGTITGSVTILSAEGEEVAYMITSEGLYTYAPELPNATVTEIEHEELTFAMNFLADVPSDDQLAYYGDWYADFELTFNKEVTLNADGTADGWLSGQYDAWSENWVNVPFENVTMGAGESLKIMAYAAEMMNQSGLKVTYNDVATGVKDFDCGVYLTPEFLAANPDLEITLELKMYNPANESESYVIGETYVFEVADYVAINMETGTLYADVTDALLEAESGETVKLMKDVDAGRSVSVFENVTLDINGCTLTTQYFTCYGDTVDNSDTNTGVVSATRMMINSGNEQLTVKTAAGYQFVEVVGFNTAVLNDGAKFVFQPLFEEAAHDLLANGIAVTGVNIQIDVSWTTENGVRTQQFKYSDSMVNDFINSYDSSTGKYGQMFTITLANAANYSDLSYDCYVISDTGVEVHPDAN